MFMATRKLSNLSLMDQSDSDKTLLGDRFLDILIDNAMLLLRFLVLDAVPVCGAVWHLL